MGLPLILYTEVFEVRAKDIGKRQKFRLRWGGNFSWVVRKLKAKIEIILFVTGKFSVEMTL